VRTKIVYHESVRNQVREWIRRLSATEPGGELIATIALNELKTHLAEHHGEIPEAEKVQNLSPPIFWWQFTSETWISYVIIDSGRWLWKKRRIVIISLGERPEDPGYSVVPHA